MTTGWRTGCPRLLRILPFIFALIGRKPLSPRGGGRRLPSCPRIEPKKAGVSYQRLDADAFAREMGELIDRTADSLVITQDLGLGMMLWMTQFFPGQGVGGDTAAAVPCHARSHVGRGGLFGPRALI